MPWKKMGYLDHIWDSEWYAHPLHEMPLSCESLFPNSNSSELTRALFHDQAVIMQFTGRKDKNGKEIYEGDIVRYADDSVIGEEGSIYEEVIVYMPDKMAFGLSLDGSESFCDPFNDYQRDFEVIGNIYENPGLLTKSEAVTS